MLFVAVLIWSASRSTATAQRSGPSDARRLRQGDSALAFYEPVSAGTEA